MFLSATLAAACLTSGLTAVAAGSEPPPETRPSAWRSPTSLGYRIKEIHNWNEETGPSANMARARIPPVEQQSVLAA